MQRLQNSPQPLLHPHMSPSYPYLLHLSLYLPPSRVTAVLGFSPAQTDQHLPPVSAFSFSSPCNPPPVFIYLPFSSIFECLCLYAPQPFYQNSTLSSLFLPFISQLLLQCHLQYRSLHKCPQNIPLKLNSGDTGGGGLCLMYVSVCECFSARVGVWGGVHVPISAHDL